LSWGGLWPPFSLLLPLLIVSAFSDDDAGIRKRRRTGFRTE
jgi:hypothetical protein